MSLLTLSFILLPPNRFYFWANLMQNSPLLKFPTRHLTSWCHVFLLLLLTVLRSHCTVPNILPSGSWCCQTHFPLLLLSGPGTRVTHFPSPQIHAWVPTGGASSRTFLMRQCLFSLFIFPFLENWWINSSAFQPLAILCTFSLNPYAPLFFVLILWWRNRIRNVVDLVQVQLAPGAV